MWQEVSPIAGEAIHKNYVRIAIMFSSEALYLK